MFQNYQSHCIKNCFRYATETLDEYKQAVKNASTLIKNGGYLVQGGVLEAEEYSFGGKRFKCHYLTRHQLLETLKVISKTTTNLIKCLGVWI